MTVAKEVARKEKERTHALATWLRAIADQIDERGVEYIDSISGMEYSVIDTTLPDDVIKTSIAGRDVDLHIRWRFAKKS